MNIASTGHIGTQKSHPVQSLSSTSANRSIRLIACAGQLMIQAPHPKQTLGRISMPVVLTDPNPLISIAKTYNLFDIIIACVHNIIQVLILTDGTRSHLSKIEIRVSYVYSPLETKG